jgi:hypothetical protein
MLMKTLTRLRTFLSAAIVCGVATNASVSSADALCRALWPEEFKLCQTGIPIKSASGIGQNVGGGGANNRSVNVRLVAGSRAQAAPLSSAGTAIPGCTVEDTTTGDVAGETNLCFSANPPLSFFIFVE